MPYVIRIVGLQKPDGCHTCLESGRYISKFMDPAGIDGRGVIASSYAIGDAKAFATAEEATAFYQTQSKVKPLRPDGKPNRPLTAFTVEIIPVEPEVVRHG